MEGWPFPPSPGERALSARTIIEMLVREPPSSCFKVSEAYCRGPRNIALAAFPTLS
jgi:hypothetical protein